VRNFLHIEQRGRFSVIAPTYREREKFCRLRPDTVKAWLVRDTLQRPGNGTVSSLGKIVTHFSVQLPHLLRRPPPRPPQLASVVVPTQFIVEPHRPIHYIHPALGLDTFPGCSEQRPRQALVLHPVVRGSDTKKLLVSCQSRS
jgi:hypothetical protein